MPKQISSQQQNGYEKNNKTVNIILSFVLCAVVDGCVDCKVRVEYVYTEKKTRITLVSHRPVIYIYIRRVVIIDVACRSRLCLQTKYTLYIFALSL